MMRGKQFTKQNYQLNGFYFSEKSIQRKMYNIFVLTSYLTWTQIQLSKKSPIISHVSKRGGLKLESKIKLNFMSKNHD